MILGSDTIIKNLGMFRIWSKFWTPKLNSSRNLSLIEHQQTALVNKMWPAALHNIWHSIGHCIREYLLCPLRTHS